jgi:predicted CopG family antitoxin
LLAQPSTSDPPITPKGISNVMVPHGAIMARSTSFSDEAFRALREEKRVGESDSDVLLRLRREARAKRKPVKRFFEMPPRFALDERDHARLIDGMRAADHDRDPWREATRKRQG